MLYLCGPFPGFQPCCMRRVPLPGSSYARANRISMGDQMNATDIFIQTVISLFAIAPVIYVIAGVSFWKQKQGSGVNYFSLFMFSVALYTFGYFLELSSANAETAFFVRNFEYLGAAFVPTFCVLFIIQNTKLFKIKARLVAFFCAVSSAIWLAYVTNPSLGIFYRSIEFSVGRYGGVMLTQKNIGYYLLLFYYIVQIIFAGVLLFKAIKRAQAKTSRRSFLFLFFTFQSAWVAVLFILLGFDEYVDPTPLTLMLIGGMFAVNEVYNDMFERHVIRWNNSYMDVKTPSALINTEGQIVCINPAAQTLIKEAGKKQEEFIALMNEAEKNRTPLLLTGHETTKWYDVKKSVFNTKRTLTSYLLTDITDEKDAALLAELFFNAIGDVVFVISPSGEILFVNDEFKTALGYSDEDINRMKILDIHPADTRNDAKRAFEQVLLNNEKAVHLSLLKKSGASIPVETRLWLGDWNGEAVIFGMAKDVSLFEQAEEKFKKSFYKNPAIMAITDVDTGEYLEVNEAFLSKLGFSAEEVIGKTGADLGIFVDINQKINAKKQLLTDGEFSGFEIDIRSKNGDRFTGLFSGSYISSGDSSNLLTVMIDVTENRKKDRLLGIITAITQDFLKAGNFMQIIPGAFKMLGETLDVNRVFLLRCELSETGSVQSILPAAEWCSDGMPQISRHPGFQKLPEDAVCCYLQPVLCGDTYVSDVAAMPKGPIADFYTYLGVKTVLTVPVFDNEKLWGVVCLHECRRERVWTEVEESAVKVFVDSLGMAIQGHNKTEKIEFLSYHDHLTGLFNRRYYEQEVARLDSSSSYPLALIMVDVNGLKLTNDAFGHAAGDTLLERIARILTGECRAQDTVARIGGDEFVILLPKTSKEQAAVVIRRLNAAIAAEKIENLVLSASVGFAVKTDSRENMNEIYKLAEDMMYRNKLAESSSVRSKTIDLILNSLYEKNGREMQHSNRVAQLCESLAKAMRFSKEDISQMSIAGMMHDIGKIGVDEAVLNKTGALHAGEWAEIKRHSEIGYRILGSVSEFSKIADYVLEHHERPDGTGYPKGLKGDEISTQAKMIALTDSYDAMTSERTYRKVFTKKAAIEEIKRGCGSQFDPDIARIFVEKVLGEKW